ncbi:MAG: FHA domain-containing protein [Planctomycetaceae bacterium]|nr:FHA domain-containing protein [Planctomycetaceae bacterium]
MPAILEPISNSNQTVTLDIPILFVGRHPDCDLILNNSQKVSRKHCCVIEVERKFLVRDLGSTNGIQVNGRKVSGLKELNCGDELTIGDCVFVFKSAEAVQHQAEQQLKADSAAPAPYRIPVESQDELPVMIDHELSSDIPILLDDPMDDGFDIGAGGYVPLEDSTQRKPKRQGSDSQAELVAE